MVTEQPTICKCQVFGSIGPCARTPWLSRAHHTMCPTSTSGPISKQPLNTPIK